MRSDLIAGIGPTTLTETWEINGTQSDVGVVTYAVVNASGTAVVSGTATKTGSGATTVYSFELPIQIDPNRLKVTWTRSDTGAALIEYLEVFGSQLFTEADARASKIIGGLTPFSDDTKYSDAVLANWRLQIQDKFESKTSRSWVRRYARVRFSADRSYMLRPFQGRAVDWEGRRLAGAGQFTDIIRIISATNHGEVIDIDDLVIDGRLLHLTSGSWRTPTNALPLNVVIEYEYGVDPPDAEAHVYALAMLHAIASPSHGPDNIDSFNNESGSYSVGPEGWAWPSKVWEWANRDAVRYHRLPGFA